MSSFFLKTILIMAIVLGGFYYFVVKEGKLNNPTITTFEECRAAGNPVLESYPEQCRTWDGTLFIREVDENNTFCTADAMQCPDGSYVGRTGPNCEFICPSGGLATITGYVHIGPTCPVIQSGYEEECKDKPYSVSIEVHHSDERLYKIIKSSMAGFFSISLPAGEYILRPQMANVLPACEEERVTVLKGKTLDVDISCDSGIR